jgi:cytochrome P450
MSHHTPPNLAKHWFWGNLREFNADNLRFVEDAATCGDVVTIYFGPFRGYFVNHPDHIRKILSSQAKYFQKPSIIRRALANITDKNIFTSNGEFWKQQRKLMQPAFHAKHIGSYADTMVEYTLRELENWKDGDEIDLDEAMTRLTMNIIIRTMFSSEVGEKTRNLGQIFTRLFQLVYRRMERFAAIPSWLPTKDNREIRQLTMIIRGIIQQFIDERRYSSEDRGDLLSILLAAQHDDASKMSDEQVIREALTIFGAGFETTAYAITFGWYALSQNLVVASKLYDEVDSVLGKSAATFHDLPKLPYTEMIVKEALRLYPTAWGFSRLTVEDVEIGGYIIPKNSIILISPWTLGRDERWFDASLRFMPERFSSENEADIPRYAFIPFGGGARICIGNQFAMMEARLVIATIAQHYCLSLKPGFSTHAQNAAFTLRPNNGMKMIVHARETTL